MADIKTILRELSVILGYILAKYSLKVKAIDKDYFLEIIKKYCVNIKNWPNEIEKIENIASWEDYSNIIKNGMELGKAIFEKLELEGEIYWVGGIVNSKYPFDIKIGDTGISLKEDSFILKNPSLSSYLNALTSPKQPFKKVHIFEHFAPDEFNSWFNYTWNALLTTCSNAQQDAIIFIDGEYSISNTQNEVLFQRNNIIKNVNKDSELINQTLFKRLKGDIFEHTFSKWIKLNLEKNDSDYITLKKNCSITAGVRLTNYIWGNLNLDKKKILELLQIYDSSYYYGKVHKGAVLYKVPSNNEVDIDLNSIEIKVPHSQLNIFFEFRITNKQAVALVVFRMESRYSHGQFKGVPEAKLYYTDNTNHLENLYKKLL